MNYYKIKAFIVKDFIIESGYKIAFLISLINSLFPVLSYFFIGKLVNDGTVSLERYGGDYFSFVLVGIAFTTYFTLAIGTFSSTMRRSQMAGCLEAILSSQTTPSEVVLMSSLYSFISAGVQLILTFLIGVVFFKFDYSQINITSVAIISALSLVIFISLGIFSAAGTIIFKKGEPFGWIFGGVSALVGGAYFPIEVLPQWVQNISVVVPITHTLEALRLAILQNYSIGMLLDKVLILLIVGLILFPLSLYFFKWSVLKGKKDGSLMQY